MIEFPFTYQHTSISPENSQVFDQIQADQSLSSECKVLLQYFLMDGATCDNGHCLYIESFGERHLVDVKHVIDQGVIAGYLTTKTIDGKERYYILDKLVKPNSEFFRQQLIVQDNK